MEEGRISYAYLIPHTSYLTGIDFQAYDDVTKRYP